MTYEEIYNLVKYSDRETDLFMPNEIYVGLKKDIKNTPHIAFAYSYIYFTTWLYRYAKHFNVEEIIDNKKIKEVLGYNSRNQTLDYLIKKNGLLDEMEYTESVRDYPVSWQYDKYNDEGLTFFMSSEIDKELSDYFPKVPNRFFLKYPVKAFARIKEEDGEEYEEAGTFYDVSNTHNISFEVFLYCMSNEKIGCAGFYLYSYLKHKNDIFENGYDVPLTNLAEDTGISNASLDRYLGELKRYRMIDFRHNQKYFVVGLDESQRKANTYISRDYDFFNDKPVPFKKIEIMKREEYLTLLEQEKPKVAKVEIPLSALPF